jgi:hypothetical protein
MLLMERRLFHIQFTQGLSRPGTHTSIGVVFEREAESSKNTIVTRRTLHKKMQKRSYDSKHSEECYSSKEPCKMSKEPQCTLFCRKRRTECAYVRFPLRGSQAEQKRQEHEAEKNRLRERKNRRTGQKMICDELDLPDGLCSLFQGYSLGFSLFLLAFYFTACLKNIEITLTRYSFSEE